MDNNNMNQPQGDQYQNTYQPVDQGQNAYQQPAAYQQPVYQNVYQTTTEYEEPVTIGNWILSMLVMLIPCVNIVMIFVWAFSSSTPKSKSNYFKACLIWFGIIIALDLVLMLLFSLIGFSMADALR